MSPNLQPTAIIRTAAALTDQHGQIAQLHGVGVLFHEGRYYAWGEEKSEGPFFSSIECYSTQNFAVWRSEGTSLGREDAGDLGPDRVVERPKVLFNSATGYFVMFLHIDSPDYAEAKLGFARSRSLVGPYEYMGSSRPLGNSSRDIGVFQEPSGLGVLMSEDRKNGLHLYRLAPDYLSVESILSTTLKNDGSHGYESPALVCVDSLYYLFGSDLTGWNMNDNKYATATSLAGPWSEWCDFAPAGSRTHESQVSTVVPIHASDDVSHVYIGDRWNQHDLYNSLSVILPISIGGGRVSLSWRDEWWLD
ncbi:glycoside hydrolase family protein [Paenarthrobacter histidinolovorans]|uniref:hypothetical protein n=1 Tax=Paenarthrobacter histidinolovorans TaxID=43664 RepID=UPI0019CEF828|nr:hypothetical protein [Paenarthrobacter histidinolovorans]GGJ22471.1 glycosyl hydrolase family 43 protein [Paenarthrobacter histidinolovorans]